MSDIANDLFPDHRAPAARPSGFGDVRLPRAAEPSKAFCEPAPVCDLCGRSPHNQGDCIRCNCEAQSIPPTPPPSPGLTHRDATATEQAAAEKIAPIREPLRVRVLAWVREAATNGITARELAALYSQACRDHTPNLASREYSVRPRLTELERAGYIRTAGGTRGGCTVWVATEKSGDGRDASPVPGRKLSPASKPGRAAIRELREATGDLLALAEQLREAVAMGEPPHTASVLARARVAFDEAQLFTDEG